MMKKTNLCIQFPSSLPKTMTAAFPAISFQPETESIQASASFDLKQKIKEHSYTEIYLYNPTAEILQTMANQSPVTLAFDYVPGKELTPLLSSYRIQVPSLTLRTLFRQQKIQAEVNHPIPRQMKQVEQKRRQIRQQWQLGNKPLIWVDERFLSPNARQRVFQILYQVQKKMPLFKVAWISNHLTKPVRDWIIMNRQTAEQQSCWLAANLFFSIGPTRISFVPLHVQLLSLGIPIITAQGGDHDEWVNHLFSGIVLSRNDFAKELRPYLMQILKNPRLLTNWSYNGRQLVRRYFRKEKP